MKASKYQFVCLMVLLCVCLTGYACSAVEKPLATYGYSFSVDGHRVSVSVSKNGKNSLKLDGKEGKAYGKGSIGAESGTLSLGLHQNGLLAFGVHPQGDDDIDIDVSPARTFHPDTRKATKLKVGKRTVFREKSTYGGDAESPKPCYDFYCLVNSGGLVFMVSQSTPVKNKNMTKEFREVVETLKIGRAGK